MFNIDNVLILLSVSGIIHTSPVAAEVTTELQNALACETEQWADCEAFLVGHFHKDSKEYKQLQDAKRQTRRHFSVPELAAFLGHTELIQVLLGNGVPVNRRYGIVERTMLYNAAQGGKDNVIALLLKHGADTEIRDRLFGNTPLLEAIFHSPSTIKLLLEAGADVNVINAQSESSFVVTVKYSLTPVSGFAICQR